MVIRLLFILLVKRGRIILGLPWTIERLQSLCFMIRFGDVLLIGISRGTSSIDEGLIECQEDS